MTLSEQNFEEFTEQCLEYFIPLQDEFIKLYDINSYENWFYDHSIGAFHFKADDGRNLYFKYLDIGSFSTKANTWKWSWDNNTRPVKRLRLTETYRASVHNCEIRFYLSVDAQNCCSSERHLNRRF
jgi:hypothetical protein